MRTSRSRRAATFAAAVGLLVVTTAPAAAHAITGIASTNYETVLLGPTPGVPGVAIRLRDLGRRVEVANATKTDVVISGYSNEPYLRVGPDGVYQNTRSPTLYQNQVTTPGVAAVVPPVASGSAPPDWHRVSREHVVRWRDQRTRHEGAAPPAVQRAPLQTHIVSTWSILMTWGTTQIVANGLIRWTPAPPAWPWYLAAVAVAGAVLAGARTSRWAPTLATATAAIVAVDVVHSLVAVVPASDSLAQAATKFFLGGLVSVVAWVAGAAGAALVEQEKTDGLFLAVFAGVVLLLTGGVGDLTLLGRSQIPYAVDPVIARALVSLTAGLGAGVIAGGIDRLRRPGAAARP